MKKLIKHPNINEGKGWDSDSWTPHITRTNVLTEPTITYTTDVTTSPRIGLNLYDTMIILLDDSIGIISKCSIR